LDEDNSSTESLGCGLETQQGSRARFEKHQADHFIGKQIRSAFLLADRPHLASRLKNLMQYWDRQLSRRDQSLKWHCRDSI
jgi:hypothetical protein